MQKKTGRKHNVSEILMKDGDTRSLCHDERHDWVITPRPRSKNNTGFKESIIYVKYKKNVCNVLHRRASYMLMKYTSNFYGVQNKPDKCESGLCLYCQ
jgi:hypothetical protein